MDPATGGGNDNHTQRQGRSRTPDRHLHHGCDEPKSPVKDRILYPHVPSLPSQRASAVVIISHESTFSMRLFDMHHLGSDGNLRWCYRAEVKVRSRRNPGMSRTCALYALDHGRRVASHGGGVGLQG